MVEGYKPQDFSFLTAVRISTTLEMIILKKLPFVDTFISVSDFFKIDTKANLQRHCDEIDIYLPARLCKADFAYSLATFFERNPFYTYDRIPESEKKIIAKLLEMPSDEHITCPRNEYQFLKIQKLHLVVSYETGTDWYIYMPDCIRKVLTETVNKDKEHEVTNIRSMMKSMPDFPDIISKYSIRSQAVIFMVLESLNQISFGTIPLSVNKSYDDDIDLLVETAIKKKSEKAFRTPVELLRNDLKSSLDHLVDSFDKYKDSSAPIIESKIDLLGYGTLLHALYELLTRMSKKPQKEIEAMLDNIEIVDGIPSFPSIENISIEVLSEIVNNLSSFAGNEMLSHQ